jgi:hypothetical protein
MFMGELFILCIVPVNFTTFAILSIFFPFVQIKYWTFLCGLLGEIVDDFFLYVFTYIIQKVWTFFPKMKSLQCSTYFLVYQGFFGVTSMNGNLGSSVSLIQSEYIQRILPISKLKIAIDCYFHWSKFFFEHNMQKFIRKTHEKAKFVEKKRCNKILKNCVEVIFRYI